MIPDENPSTPDMKRLREEAGEWIARRDAGFTAHEQDAFFDWLAAHPKHAEIYAELHAVYRQMDVMVQWRPLHALEPNPDLLASPPPRPRRATWLPLALGMAAVLVLGLLLVSHRMSREEPTPTLLAEGATARAYERHVLQDGSVVEMNRGAQVSLRFEPNRRVLDLIAGEAHFTVAKDPSRPFIVQVGGVAVTAVGTEFTVALGAGQLEVFVTEGRIRVEAAPGVRSAPEPGGPATDRTLEAGQGVVVGLDAPAASAWKVELYPAEVLERKLAWKNDLVDFTGVPLSEIILEFNRRNHTQLVIGDPELGDLRMNGTLRPGNLEGFVALLTLTHGVRAERHDTSKIVLRKQAQP